MATAAQIQAEIAAGPQTQDALDAILVKYSPADLAAAFPQFGGEEQYASARAEAEQREFIAWQSTQPNPVGQGTIGDVFAAQGITDPKNDPRLLAQAQQQINRTEQRQGLFDQAGVQPSKPLAPWSEPNWRETEEKERQAEADRQARLAAIDAKNNVVVGGGLLSADAATPRPPSTPKSTAPATGGLLGSATTPAAPALTLAQSRIQAIQQFFNANAGRTDPQAQPDLNRFLATSGFTAREINAAVPQFAIGDLQNAMRTAIGEVSQQTPFAPAVTQPLAQPYTSIASQLPGGADARAQEIRNYYAANEGRGDQAGLDRFLASGYSAQEINRALPQFGVNDLERVIGAARQAYPDAALQRQLAAYQATAPGAQFTGAVSPYGLLTQQTQAFRNPYADSLANTSLGGYNPGVYNILLDEKIDPVTGIAVPVDSNAGGAGGIGNDGGEGGSGSTAGPGGFSGITSETATDSEGGTVGDASRAHGGLITQVFGPDPDGPDEGQVNIQRGEYVIKKSAVKKYGKGLLDMINDGKVPAKKMKSLLG